MTLPDFVRPLNTLDVSILEAGDILIVANPTDMPLIRYVLFWSHVGLVTERGDVIDAVREPRGEGGDGTSFYQVHRSSMAGYLKSYDIVAVRPVIAAERRRAAAAFAETKLGAPYAADVLHIIFGRSRSDGYSCASLAWQAYRAQGLDLCPLRLLPDLNVIPLLLARDALVRQVGRGCRYHTIPRSERRLRAERRWFKRALGADIAEYGESDS